MLLDSLRFQLVSHAFKWFQIQWPRGSWKRWRVISVLMTIFARSEMHFHLEKQDLVLLTNNLYYLPGVDFRLRHLFCITHPLVINLPKVVPLTLNISSMECTSYTTFRIPLAFLWIGHFWKAAIFISLRAQITPRRKLHRWTCRKVESHLRSARCLKGQCEMQQIPVFQTWDEISQLKRTDLPAYQT